MSSTPESCVVALYESSAGAVEGARALLRTGLNVNHLSVAGKDVAAADRVVALYTSGKRVKFWGQQADAWNALSDELCESSLFYTPRLGPIVVIGPLVDCCVAALDGIQGPHAASVLAAALVRLGTPANRAADYEAQLELGKVLLAALAPPSRLEPTRSVLVATRPLELATYEA